MRLHASPERRLRPLLCVIAPLLAAACGADAAPDRSPPPLPDTIVCLAGETVSPAGGCMSVGIQKCAALFLGSDGLCHPSSALCAPGTIPKFDEGCVPVGIPSCAAEFRGDDGICHVSMAKCPSGTFAVPQEGCVSIDGPDGCGDAPWGHIADRPGNVYVDPSYAGADGDGSRDRPVATIAAAAELVRDGGRIALAAGRYAEPARITKSIELAGRCASMVEIGGTLPTDTGPVVVMVNASGAAVRGVTVDGPGTGVDVYRATDVVLDRLVVRRSSSIGARLGDGSTVAITHSLFQNARDGGVVAGQGASVTLASSAVVDNRSGGVFVYHDGTTVTVRQSLLEGSTPTAGSSTCAGAMSLEGGSLTVADSAVVGNALGGVASISGSLVATGLVVEGTHAVPTQTTPGSGVVAVRGARLSLGSSVIAGSEGFGLALNGAGTEGTATATLIQDTTPFDQIVGEGVEVAGGARLALVESTLLRSANEGVAVLAPGSTLDATGNLVEGTLGVAGEGTGVGFHVEGGTATLTSNAVVGNAAAGIYGVAGATVTATENLVEGTRPRASDRQLGRGFEIDGGGVATLARNLFADNPTGIAALGNPDAPVTFAMTGGLIRNAQVEIGGEGLLASYGTFSVQGAAFRDCALMGMMFLSGATATVTAAAVDTVRARPLDRVGDVGPETPTIGDGLLAVFGAHVDITGATLTGCDRAGVLYMDSDGTLANVRSWGNRFGVVLGGARRPTIGEGAEFADNTERDQVSDGDLAVPDAPVPLP